ncbi:tumor protein p63-regulated gene 1-like protein isoform X1 [Rhinatrema bivittatum]|uniref:tumor protein p63-regulated gene 1-like protein isoform X1 n=1 Tax=Rhinatrema bivittatum TaxID=194408 RepID=UPI001125D140|nr:tumor protein p63-regulated gene 1-like protein isoform X1 [Rhinatrema bivittatum]
MQALPRYRETEEDPHPLPLVIEPRKEHPVPAGTANVSHLYSKEPRLGYSPTSVPVSTSHKNTPGKGEYFILRNGSLEQAIVDVKSVLSPVEDGEVQSIWILTEVDHWNNDQERLIFLTHRSLLLCHYDFVSLCGSQLFRIPLNFIDTLHWGELSYPSTSLNKRQGQSLRIGWDKLRPLSFLARWNPWSSDLPYVTLMQHPAAGLEESVSHMFQLEQFQEQLVECVKRAHRENPLPGRANGPLVLEQPIPMETYLGLMSLLSSKAQLGYAKSRGAFGF